MQAIWYRDRAKWRLNVIWFRDVHSTHDRKTYVLHVVWTPSSFATETSVVWALSGFCDVHSTHVVEM